MEMEIDINDIYDEVEAEMKKEVLIPPTTEDETFEYDEETILADLSDDFEYQIKQRGTDYYESDNVLKVCKSEDDNRVTYNAKVYGRSEKPYNVTIEVDDFGIDYSCDCPYEYPCKHEYAVLLAIHNKKYEETKVKPTIKEKEVNIKSILENIPAEELKKYFIERTYDIKFNNNSFAEYFRKYYPVQKYEFYYNNLYNAMIFESGYEELIKMYFSRIKQYISGNNFQESYKIIKSIINAYHDSKSLNLDEYFTDILPTIGMYLRVTYRKANDTIKKQIEQWMLELEKEKYYNNYYLEDIILSIK